MLSGQSVGVLMSFEMPPNAASIWSAKITEGDRDQRLAQVLALVPAQEDLLQDHAEIPDDQRGQDQRHDPLTRS